MEDDQKSNGHDSLSTSFLRTTRQIVEEGLEDVVPEREDFFQAFFLLQQGDVEGAIEGFREASRTSSPPFDALSMVAVGECQRLLGKQAAATREWTDIAEDEDAPHAARYVAWLSLAALAEERDDEDLLSRANEALEAFSDEESS